MELFNMNTMTVAFLLAVVIERIVEFFARPLKENYPNVNFFWLIYVALVLGGAVGWFSEMNLFELVIPNVTLGRILTAVLLGGGPSLIHEISGYFKQPEFLIEVSEEE